MKRLRWIAAAVSRTLDWSGIAGCALLVLSAALCVVRVLPLQQQIARYQSLPRPVEHSAETGKITSPAPAWEASIPLRTELSPQLLEVRRVAEQSGVDIGATDYSLTEIDGTSLWRYQMLFLIQDDYVSVQSFIGQLLNAFPNLALNGIDIARSDEEEGLVTANLRFAFYFRQK